MLKTRSYILIALAVYFSVILVKLPASLVIRPLEQQIQTFADIDVESVSGSLWQGSVQTMMEGERLALNWDWKVWHVFLFRLTFDIHLKSEPLEVKSRLSLSPGKIQVEDLNGIVNMLALGQLLQAQGIQAQIENDVYLRGLSLVREEGRFGLASGLASWEGGVLRARDLPKGEATFPALQALLSNDESGLLVNLRETGNEEATLLDISLNHSGQAHLRLREQVANYVEIPSQLVRGNPSNVWFEIKRQVFETGGVF